MRNKNNIPDIAPEKFKLVGVDARLHDQKFETKQVSYFRDAFNRFCKNKSSVVAAIIILCLVLYAIFVPIFCETNYSLALRDTNYLNYVKLPMETTQFGDGFSKDDYKALVAGMFDGSIKVSNATDAMPETSITVNSHDQIK